MKGIILLGGAGTRMRPIGLNKHLLPVGMVPMAYHSMSTLFLASIREILIITTPKDIDEFSEMFGDGSKFGVSFTYGVQEKPGGIAEAFLVHEEFIDDDSFFLVLGDNIGYAAGLTGTLSNACENADGAHIFGRHVDDPERFGVATVDTETKKVIEIVEKPKEPKSDLAVIGWYIYSNGLEVREIARKIPRSAPPRSEKEITSVNQVYVEQGRLEITVLPFGLSWLDTGTHQSYNDACASIMSHFRLSGHHYGSLEQIALSRGWIGENEIEEAIKWHGQSQYAEYLKKILKAHHRDQTLIH